MKTLIASTLLFFGSSSFAGSFVDSLAKEYGKKNGCYSISLDKNKKNYSKASSEKKKISTAR
tara:strand:+ start:1599 stop:1784 length:186 start_codon:yes stop_codon:yes gene_type:complete